LAPHLKPLHILGESEKHQLISAVKDENGDLFADSHNIFKGERIASDS
jgi:hypothetical protein